MIHDKLTVTMRIPVYFGYPYPRKKIGSRINSRTDFLLIFNFLRQCADLTLPVTEFVILELLQ